MVKKGKAPSNTAKGSKRKIETSCVAWFDLLGYGDMLRKGAFDPTHESTSLAIERLDAFQTIVQEHTCKYFLTLTLNDGGAAHRDLSPRDSSVTYDFIKRAYDLHRAVNEYEQKNGFPGLRMVVAGGFRLRRNQQSKNDLLNGYGKSLVQKAESGEIPIREAINKAITVKPFSAAVPELQANFAFSKAYIAEATGTKAGITGPAMYLDSSLVNSLYPNGLLLGDQVEWKYPGLDTIFCKVLGADPVEAGRYRFSDYCNAFQVAQNLSVSEDVITRLKRQPIGK